MWTYMGSGRLRPLLSFECYGMLCLGLDEERGIRERVERESDKVAMFDVFSSVSCSSFSSYIAHTWHRLKVGAED